MALANANVYDALLKLELNTYVFNLNIVDPPFSALGKGIPICHAFITRVGNTTLSASFKLKHNYMYY